MLNTFHQRNHKACLDPNHRQFLPEVDIYKHGELKQVNTSMSEQFNAWLSRYAPHTSTMHPATFKLYLHILAFLWNRDVVPKGLTSMEMQVIHTSGGHLRRLRRRVELGAPPHAGGSIARASASSPPSVATDGSALVAASSSAPSAQQPAAVPMTAATTEPHDPTA